jgi:hypothetical protein
LRHLSCLSIGLIRITHSASTPTHITEVAP